MRFFGLVFGLFIFLRVNSATMSEQTVQQFVTAVNTHQLDKMSALLSNDHTYTDAGNVQHTGSQKAVEAWKAWFEWFPDYKLEIEQWLPAGDTVAVFGYASGTFHTLSGDTGAAHWRLPFAGKAVVKQGVLTAWQVYADTKVPTEIVDRYTSAVQEGKVVNFGGVFFKSEKPKELAAWYDKHLGTAFGTQGYSMFKWRDYETKQEESTTFGIFKASSEYFKPSEKPFMFNFIVRDLEGLMKKLKAEGVQTVDEIQSYDYGKFGWIVDMEGNKIELWQPMGGF